MRLSEPVERSATASPGGNHTAPGQGLNMGVDRTSGIHHDMRADSQQRKSAEFVEESLGILEV